MNKKIIFCFDGTANEPRSVNHGMGFLGSTWHFEDVSISNIFKIHAFLGGNLSNKPSSILKLSKQHSFYYSGVGTYGNSLQRIFNTTLALENFDVRRIILDARDDFLKCYQPGDNIFLFGFSRGAAIARRFAALINDYLGCPATEKTIDFLGVFDTIASIDFIDKVDINKLNKTVVFKDQDLAESVKECVHLISLDEIRKFFTPTLINKNYRVQEIWFAGGHSDVGGGYFQDGLSDIALDFMLEKLHSIDRDIILLSEDEIDYGGLRLPKENYKIICDDLEIKPNHRAISHAEKIGLGWRFLTRARRKVRVDVMNKPSHNLPIIHESVLTRARDIKNYNPSALAKISYKIISPQGNLLGQHFKGRIKNHLNVA